jgi:hypothetical protein
MTEYKVNVWETVMHTVWLESNDEEQAYDDALAKIQAGDEDTIYDREFTGDYDVEDVNA